MPEESHNSSGTQPEEKQVRPTVIRTDSTTKKPTVIGGGQPSAPVAQVTRKPTVIGGGQQPSPEPAVTPKPSVIGGSEQQSAPPPRPAPSIIPSRGPDVATPQYVPTKATVPTSIPGTKRKRLAVTIDDLERRNVGTKESVLKASLDLILVMNLDDLKERDVVMWGHDLQRRYSELVTKCLTMSQSDDLKNTKRNIARILEILETIDLQAVFLPQGGILSRFTPKSKKKIDTLDELETAQDELRQLLDLLDKRLGGLLTLKEDLDLVSGEIDEIGDSVEASAITAAFLADQIAQMQHVNQHLSQRFADRGMSLVQTLVQIRGSSSMRETQIEQPLALISKVQDVALVMVPGLVGTIVSLKTLTEQNQKPTVTTVAELGDQIGLIVQKLGGN